MLRCVVPLYLVEDAPRLLRGEALVQRPHGVSVQIVCDKHDLVGIRKVFVHQFMQNNSKVMRTSLLGHRNPAPPSQWLTYHEHVSHATSLVPVVFPCVVRMPWLLVTAGFGRQGVPARCVSSQLLVLLVYTYHRVLRIIRTLVHTQHIFHLSHELGCASALGVVAHRQAPALYFPRTKPVFFRRFITPTSEMVSMYPNSTILS